MQCLSKRDFGHFRPFAGYFRPFAVSFRPTIVPIQRKTCRSFRLKKEKTARRRKFLTKPEKADFSVQAEIVARKKMQVCFQVVTLVKSFLTLQTL